MTDDTLYRLTPKAFRYLEENCDTLLNEYRNPDADFDNILREAGYTNYKEKLDVRITGTLELQIIDNRNPRCAELQALVFYNSLHGMSPRLATDPRIFAYINHFYLHKYGIARWGIAHDNDEQAQIDIRNHWITFTGNFTDLYKSNISGRTWWIAHTASMAAKASNNAFMATDALKIFVDTAEYYHRTMEWEFLCNYSIMAECIRSLLEESKGMSINKYRDMLSRLNREGGGRILDALDRNELRKLVINASHVVQKA